MRMFALVSILTCLCPNINMNTISTPKRTFQLLSFTVTKWQPAIHCSFLLIIDFLIGTTSCSFHEAAAEQYVWMNPCDGFYSQPSVGHSVHELHTKMCESGYDKRFPINGVRYPDGRTVFFDNRRPLAACMAGVQVYVRVHDCDALAPKAVRNNPMLSRPICLCDGTTIAPPDQMTWGDAIRMRSIGGARFNGGHLPEAPLYPPGRQQAPSIRLPCEIDGMLAAPAPRLQAPPTTTPPRPSNCINGPSLSGPPTFIPIANKQSRMSKASKWPFLAVPLFTWLGCEYSDDEGDELIQDIFTIGGGPNKYERKILRDIDENDYGLGDIEKRLIKFSILCKD